MAEPAIAVATAGGTRTLICGSGPPLVLVHGVGMSAAFWRPQLFALAPHRMVVAYDMLGHGEAPLPPVKPSLDDYADQLQGVLNGLGLGRVALVGHSMGALVVLHHALAHPERVERVVAMNAVYCRSPEQLAAVQARAADLESGRTAEGRRQTLARWFGDPAPPALGPVAAWVDAALAGVDFVGYARTYRLFASSDAAHRGTARRAGDAGPVPHRHAGRELHPRDVRGDGQRGAGRTGRQFGGRAPHDEPCLPWRRGSGAGRIPGRIGGAGQPRG